MHPKITAAKVDAVLDPNLCFFGSLLCHLKYVEDPMCETAWTDGTRLGYNPAFIESLPHAEIVGLLAHEVLHCAMGHPWRRDLRNFKRWNVACDLAINQVITSAGIALPEGSLTATKDQVGKSAEWIYDRLPESEDSDEGNDGQGRPTAPGEVRDGQGQGSSEEQGQDKDGQGQPQDSDSMSEGEWKQAVRTAATEAKMRGKLPAGLDRFAKQAAVSRVDWKSAMRKFIEEVITSSDFTWKRPSQRYMAAGGIYMPSMYSEECPRIAGAQDTSGSMDDLALAKGQAEFVAIMNEVKPQAIDLFFCDASIAGHNTFDKGDDIIWRPKGGGSTDFRPVFDAIEKLDEKPVCLIYFTDLYGTFPEAAPDIPTLWVTDNDQIAPFGETIKIDY